MYDCQYEDPLHTTQAPSPARITHHQLEKQYAGRNWARFIARHGLNGTSSLSRLRTIALNLGLELRPLADGSVLLIDVAASEIFTFHQRFAEDLLVVATICRI